MDVRQAAQAARQDAHHVDGEHRRFVYEEEKMILVNRHDLTIGLGDGGSITGFVINQAHLAEDAARFDSLDNLAVGHNIHLAFSNSVHIPVRYITFVEDDRASGIRFEVLRF